MLSNDATRAFTARPPPAAAPRSCGFSESYLKARMPRRSENVHDALVDARDQLARYRVIMGDDGPR